MKKRNLLLSLLIVWLMPMLSNAACDQDFYRTLRYGEEYDFADSYNANSSDKWVRDKSWTYDEKGWDFNQSTYFPKFRWTQAIKDADWKVAKGTSMVVMETYPDQPGYEIKAVPTKRSYDNLLLTYTIESSTNAEWNNKYNHTECVHYAITRCGDGILDTVVWNWETREPEECDPAAPEWKNRTDWLKCNASCKIEYEEPKCSSQYNGKKVYTTTSSPYLNVNSSNLCDLWKLTQNTFKQIWTPIQFTWWCTNGGKNTTSNACSLKQYRCGDGQWNWGWDWSSFINWVHYESCDPKAPEWINWKDGQICKSNCTTEYKAALCGSRYKGKTQYQSINNPWLTSNTPGLCDEWQVINFNFDRTTWKYQWYCKNGDKTSEVCPAQQLWCGDGKVTDEEKCDPADTRAPSVKWRWEGTLKTCSNSCVLTSISGPACNSQYDKQTKYQPISLGEWLKNDMNPSLCANWKVTNFKSDAKSPRTFTWNCVVNWVSASCSAKQEWCGDGKVTDEEKCDFNDWTHTWWGDGWCSQTCQPTYNKWQCGSTYRKKKTYLDISKDWITKTTPGLCEKWNVTNFYKHSSSHVYTWQCDNHWNISDTCRADQEWCGDGVLNWTEQCDDWSKNGTKDSLCSNTCKSVNKPVCGSKDKGERYFTNKQTTPRLTENDWWMCGAWLTVGKPYMAWTDSHIEWKCSNTNGDSVTCRATQIYCGDGVKNWTEQCDDWSKNGTKDSSCSKECKTVSLSCGSMDWKTKYFSTRQTSTRLTNSEMCPSWQTVWNQAIVWTDYHMEWTCSNQNWAQKICKAYQIYCGDGVLNWTEQCDDWSKNGTKDSSCSKTCEKTRSLSCGSKNWTTTYFSTKQTKPWISNAQYEMCPQGLTAWQPSIVWTDYHMEWTCSNQNWAQTTCKAYQIYCGDGVIQKDNKEECDGGNDCDYQCKIIPEPEWCDEEFRQNLRFWQQYTFYDDFNANSSDKWLRKWSMDYEEQYDYNKSSEFPIFDWTQTLINNEYKVAANQTMRVLEAKTPYPILAIPEHRAYNNLFIKYVLVSSTDKEWRNKHSHSECGFYEISRCWDWIVDKAWTWDKWESEECDPGSEWTSVLPDWNICNAECKIVKVPAPVCSSKYNGQTVDSLLSGDYLCETWTISDFNFDETTNTWTWKCNNVAWIGKECSATKKAAPKWAPEIKKTLQNKVEVKEVWQKLNWEVRVTAKWWDIKDFEILDVMPNELKYLGWDYKDGKPDRLTVTKQDKVWTSWDNKVYYWDVKWTLQEWESLTIVVKSEVEKMPSLSKVFKNIACVNDDGKVICDPESVPAVCNSKYSGKTVNDLKESNELCIIWKVTGFKFDEAANRWTWWCNNEESTVTCWAQKPTSSKWAPEIEKTLKNKVIVGEVGQKLTWTVKVTANWWDIKDFKVLDKLPKVLKYETYRIVKNGDNLTLPKQPSGPVESWSNNIYTWDIIWTLQQGHELILEIDSTVEKMPTEKDDYLNIACVEDDKVVDCDDARPWTADIEKTLDNKIPVDHIGQDLTWIVKVTAKWWDIENFEIWDKMPKEISYVSFELDKTKSQGNVTVTYDDKRSPKSSWDVNIHYWNTKWVLYSWNSIVMNVKTKVEKMPAEWKDILNIACVIWSGNEIDCGEDKPPKPDAKWELIPLKTLKWPKEIVKTWDEVIWSLKVTASWWNVTDFIMTDEMPPVLWYSGYKVEHTWSVNDIIFLWENKEKNTVSWKVKWTLKEGDNVEIYLTTYAKEMPDKKYKNVLCVSPEDKPEDKKCEDEPIHAPDLRIKKSFTDWTKKKTAKIWDEIAYKVTFGNSGNASATITSIKDFLPKNVDYVTWSIVINRNSVYSKDTWDVNINILRWNPINGFKKIDWVRIEIYGGMTLEPGDKWYIILTGKVKGDFTGNTTNFACIYLNDEMVDCDDATHDIKPDDMKCEKLEVPAWNLPNGWWSKDVRCTAWGKADLIEIDCGNGTTITWENKSELKGTCTYLSWAKTYSLKCTVKKDGKDYTSNSCNWSVTVNWTSWPSWSSCFVAWTKVTMADGTQKNIEDVKIWEKVLWSNGTVNTVLWYDRPVLWGRHLWSINGSEYFVSDEHPFKTIEWWKSFNPEMTKLEVDLDTRELKVWDILVTDNGLEEVKTVDYISADYNTPLFNLMLNGDHTYYANNYLVHNKCIWECCNGWCRSGGTPTPTDYCEKHSDSVECNLADEHCFNVNVWNFSVEYWEYLPLYFNVNREKNSDYTYIFAEDKQNCEPATVDLWSLKCKYLIRRSDKVVAYESDEFDCLTLWNERYTDDEKPLIKKWAEQQRTDYTISIWETTYWRYWPTIKYTNSKKDGWNILNDKGEEVLWEYMFQIEVTRFNQCEPDSDWKWWHWKEIPIENAPVCQNNFVLSKPYTVQKTPSGNLTASTKTLKNFVDIKYGKGIFSNYLTAISTSEYTPNAKVKEAMDVFIKKYEKLAVKVNTDKFWNGLTVKKVPWKDIYFLDGNATFTQSDKTINKPFTIVQTNGDTTINGNLQHNMMLLTNGKIKFQWDCTNIQTVRWIFYASWDLERLWVKKNDELSNNVWCKQWWLNVKWVLIWNNFNGLMEKSRSHLETWFDDTDTSSKATKIMNWASVLIEYSPSIFTKSTMPPGAEDFTTALSIYKN